MRAIQQAADIGAALGGDAAEDAKTYSTLAAKLREEFHTGFYDSSKKQYDNGAMITNVLPLALDAVPSSERDTVFQNLLNHINEKNGTWSGGIINNRFLFDVLHDNGAADIALSMLKKKDYPSYGYMFFNDLEPARECMWELPDAPYQGTGMNSRNHHMFSSVGHYLVTRVAGLTRGPGAREFTTVVGTEQTSSASLQTQGGDVKFGWNRKASRLEVDVVVPVGMKAHVHVPADDGYLSSHGGALLQTQLVERHGAKFNVATLTSGTHRIVTAEANIV